MKKYRTNAVFQSYDNFVKQSYLDVPAEDRMVVEDLFGKIELSDMTDKIDYINYVVGYLRKNYKYTMKPGKVPEGRSVVDYFLKESKKGYCTYFATSAAIILRSAGIRQGIVQDMLLIQDYLIVLMKKNIRHLKCQIIQHMHG